MRTKRRYIPVLTYLLVLALLCGLTMPVLADGAGTVVYRSTQSLAEGLDCVTQVSWNAEVGREQSWTLIYSASADVRPIVAWGEGLKQGDTLTSAAAVAENRGMNVLAGFNSDFFDMASGTTMGVVVSGGVLYSSDNGRSAVGFAEDGRAIIGYPGLTLTLRNHGGAENTVNAGTSLTVSHYNKQPGIWVFDLLSRDFAEDLNLSGSWYIAEVRTLEGKMTIGGQVDLEVERILTVTDERYTIPEDRMILIAQADGYAAWNFAYLAEGDSLTLEITPADERFTQVTEACGGGDILVAEGQITDEAAWDSTVSRRNPRTALGIRPDGAVLFYVCDGRSSGRSNGLTLYELAQELRAQGCDTVLNLDGGGSTTLATQQIGEAELTVRNYPSDGFLRSCAMFLLLVTTTESDGHAAHLALETDGALLTRSAALELGAVLAADSGYEPVPAPEDVEIGVLAGPGDVQDGVYRAEGEPGSARLYLRSADTQAVGYATVHVLSDVSQVSLDSILVGEGDVLQLSPGAAYYGMDVVSAPEAYDYTLEGDLGTVSRDGLLEVDAVTAEQSGTVTVAYGTARATAAVDVYCRFADTQGHWAQGPIEGLAKTGVVKGTIVDGQRVFSPDDTITRQEFCVMLARLLGLWTEFYEDMELPFADRDTVGSWAVGSLGALYDLGIVTGSLEGGELYANPTAALSRQEVCTILARALGMLPEAEEEPPALTGFTDASDTAAWAVQGVRALVDWGLISGFEDGSLRPGASTTRAQIAKLLYGATGG